MTEQTYSCEQVEVNRLSEVSAEIAKAEVDGISAHALSGLANEYATGTVMLKRIRSENASTFNEEYEPTYNEFFNKHKNLIK